MRKVVIEVRINEYASRAENPNVPWTASEIGADARACIDAGASIIHFHPRKADGQADYSYDGYREVMAALRSVSDAMTYPTLGVEMEGSAEQRLDHVLQLVADGFEPDFAPLDMVSSNLDLFDWNKKTFVSEDAVYTNSTRTLRYFAETMRDAGVTPQLGAWHIPALRQISAFLEAGYLTPPLFVSLGMTEGGALGTHPGSLAGLRAYFDFLPTVPIVWEAMLFRGNLLPLIPHIVEAGGNIGIGIGDYAYPELDYPTNAKLVEEVVRQIRAAGADVASVEESRLMLNRPHRAVADQTAA